MQPVIYALLALTVAGLVAAFFMSARRQRLEREPELPLPSLAIRVSGWRKAELQAILAKFDEMYGVGNAKLAALDAGIYAIDFRSGLTAMNASFLVNYLHYPHDFDLDNRKIVAAARYPAKAAIGLPDSPDADDRLTIFVPVPDVRYDRVWGVVGNSGRVLEQDFGRMAWKPVDGKVPDAVGRLFVG